MKTLVIGNGPSLLEGSLGEIIDKYDVVIRINDYMIKGFEKSAGTKTDIWTMDTAVFDRRGEFGDRFKTMPKIWIMPSISYTDSYDIIRQQAQQENDDVYMFPRVKALAVRFKVGSFPSTGMNVITAAIQQFGCIDIVGFDHFSSDKIDYWDDDDVVKSCPHKADNEQTYVASLIKKGKVTRL